MAERARVHMPRSMAKAIRMAVVEAGCTGPTDLITRVALMEPIAVAAILKHWPDDWRTDTTRTMVRIAFATRDYLLDLAPEPTTVGRPAAASGIPVLVEMVRSASQAG